MSLEKENLRPDFKSGSSEKGASNETLEMNEGVSSEAAHLKRVLADSFVLYMKTYAVHWNYKGAKFFSVHKLTEQHYQELAEAIDEIAERIRAKGYEAPISLFNILQSADLNEMKDHAAGTDKALLELAASHELLAKCAQEAAEFLADRGDLFSADMMIKRIGAHQKASWMLKSFLQTGY